MSKSKFTPPTALSNLQHGPLGPSLGSFAQLLSQQGYCQASAWLKVRLAAKFSRWLHRHHTPLSKLNEARVTAFLNARRKHGRPRSGDRSTMALLLQHLRQTNLVPPSPSPPKNDNDLIIQDYERFLRQERSLMESTTTLYVTAARRFLDRCFPRGKARLRKLKARNITDFVLHDTANYSGRVAQLTATVLRSLLGFLFQQGRIPTNLGTAVPRVPNARLAPLPYYLEAEQVDQVLRSCDRRRKAGKRDYAILLVLARLGLRAGEVVRLTLDDIDWRAGELLIRGKGARVDRLPLLEDVGRALADYLQRGRPDCSSRQVFIQCKAPYGGFGRRSVGTVVRAALIRAQVQSPHQGAHVLRHSLATRMLRHGASLAQIGQVLRHQLPQTTEIYAKVDLNALRTLALPWPGGAL